ncbi:MAG: hypothetical protein ACJAV1_001379, partial [Paraglaciecola sp.]
MVRFAGLNHCAILDVFVKSLFGVLILLVNITHTKGEKRDSPLNYHHVVKYGYRFV